VSKIYRTLEKATTDRDRKGTKTSSSLRSVEEEQRLAEVLFWPETTQGKSPVLTLVSFFQHDNIASEQFRKLRTHLTHVDVGSPPRTIM